MVEEISASGGICAPYTLLYMPYNPRFRPLRGFRNWFRRGNAGGPLLGHVTPPHPKLGDLLPMVTVSRGGINYYYQAWQK